MFKEKCVEAEIEEIISCAKGYSKIITTRGRTSDSVERRIRWGSAYRNHDYSGFDYDREHFMSSLYADSVEQDPWSNDIRLETYEPVMNNTLRITYQYGGQKYEKIVKRESYNDSYHVGEKLFVSFYVDSPETIIDISDEDILSGLRMMQFGFAILPILMMLLLLSYII